MGDGRVALILDVMGLAQSARILSGSRDKGTADANESSGSARSNRQTLLVMQVGGQRRFALPLSQVTRLEKIAANKIEIAGDQEVVQYRGEILSLIRLSNALGIQASAGDLSLLDAVVYTRGKRSIGLVVDQITDIVEADVINQRQASRPGIASSVVVQNQVTDLIDLKSIIQMTDPDFFNHIQEDTTV
jgi:two-component system chemotaxis sensor kinase CheA